MDDKDALPPRVKNPSKNQPPSGDLIFQILETIRLARVKRKNALQSSPPEGAGSSPVFLGRWLGVLTSIAFTFLGYWIYLRFQTNAPPMPGVAHTPPSNHNTPLSRETPPITPPHPSALRALSLPTSSLHTGENKKAQPPTSEERAQWKQALETQHQEAEDRRREEERKIEEERRDQEDQQSIAGEEALSDETVSAKKKFLQNTKKNALSPARTPASEGNGLSEEDNLVPEAEEMNTELLLEASPP